MKKLSLRTRLTRLQELFSDSRRWGQFTFRKKKGDRFCYCLAGGLNKISERSCEEDIPDDEIKALGFETEGDIFNWNDDKNRTIKDVRARIATAITNLKPIKKTK